MNFSKYFFFIFTLFQITAWAQDDYSFNANVQVIQKGSDIFLQGKNCQLLKAESAALLSWTKRVNESGKVDKCSCSGGVCLQRVNAQIPAFANDKQFKRSKNDGPNCWNATLVASKIVPQVRYTSQEEMHFWMTSPLCREKKMSEAPAPGDVIAIRDGDVGEVHGFIHLSDNLSFSKNGYDREMAYSLQDPNFVFDTYGVPEDCRRKTGEPEECHVWANYYTCQSIDEYMKKHPIKNPKLKNLYKEISDIECSVSEIVFNGSMNEIQSLQKIMVETIKTLAWDTIENKKYGPDERVIWEGIYYKALSLQDQMSLGQNAN